MPHSLAIRRAASWLAALWLALALCGVWLTLTPVAARADGDPGSDVLVYQPLFVAADAGVSVPDQVRLSGMLDAAAKAHHPIRVAVVARRDDLGAVTALWGKPQAYARFLGIELSLSYDGPLLVVMPDGFGLRWPGHATAPTLAALDRVRIAGGAAGMVAATETATETVGRALGIVLRPGEPPAGGSTGASRAGAARGDATVPTITVGPSHAGARRAAPSASSPAHGSATGSTANATDEDVALGAAVAIALATVGFALGRRGRWRRPAGALWAAVGRRASGRLRWIAPAGGVAIVGLALALALVGRGGGGSDAATAAALTTNPSLDPGTRLSGRPAPDFTLYDQSGRPVSLRSFRGKVTLLDFNDSECTTICPLTTTAMLDAKRMLGPAGRDVQLLGVDANPRATSIEDVLSYTQLHGLVGRWRFLTGSVGQLRRVWHAYGIDDEIERGLIAHTPALFVIDRRGRLRELYDTQQSYSAVDQLGQIVARAAARLLPGHPTVDSDLSYAPVRTIAPRQATTLPRAGGGRVAIGPGRPRLYVFFDTWDREVMPIAGRLDAYNAYARSAAGAGLPSLVAVDEGSVEPSPAALPAFLRTLPRRLRYPVAVDASGRVADGYEVQGAPWLVLVSASGKIAWYDNLTVGRWPTVAQLRAQVRAALATGRPAAASARLIGSPGPLAALHAQASRLIGADSQLRARIRALRGYPIVVNAWESYCEPCQKEFGLLASASKTYGRQVAFLGADANDTPGDGAAFLREHPVSYPSYATTTTDLAKLARGGVQGYPTTIYIDRAGHVVDVHSGQYVAQGTLDSDIVHHALDGR